MMRRSFALVPCIVNLRVPHFWPVFPEVGISSVWEKRKLALFALFFLTACSPRDFLSRRLATDLIVSSEAFRTPQQFILQTGIRASGSYPSPEFLALQHHGWITANSANCPPAVTPPPCWDVLLTPSGVETIHALLPAGETDRSPLSIPVAKREFVEVIGISKQDSAADVEFTWHWVPLNEIGAALYSSDLHYRSTVGFRRYDDGWRVTESVPHPGQTLEDALKNAEPVP
jgi:hypothetical protein